MKSLSEKFQFLNLEADRVLTRDELKSIYGGAECGPAAGGAVCPNNLCCSAYGFCGDTTGYCDANCDNLCSEPSGKCTTGGGMPGTCTAVTCLATGGYFYECFA
ncbi:hypothetical protein SIO70_02245 [Chitinophaga sancti]|uniref:hypothetical protein n=1 Tax=Chitinophaga sancti TaxID=1004 RepID=UPI002A756CD5|nr:hypothetical protein [Chitinophaga sancti]WPQ63680.1 hypothetical protein SIO70_02245 [Chitinophaga sancti]